MSVLLYHSVHPVVEDEFCQITPLALRDQLQFLLDCGATFIPFSSYMSQLLAERLPSRVLTLTFDDGYEDFVEHALPVLKELGLTATQFICPAHAGHDNRWNFRARFRARHMETSTLRALPVQGIELQPHGWTHRNFFQLSARELEHELRLCVDYFHDELNLEPAYLAYPYGAVRPDQASTVANLFQAAVGVNPIPDVDPHYAVIRTTMVQMMDREDLKEIWRMLSTGEGEAHDGR
jgi:peptidoglycan/xylan/chitin deacetylase (PgdA/CDA1 family)